MTETTPRTALITGASAGLGAEFAQQLAAQGWHLVLVARRLEKLTELAQSLTDTHGVAVHTISGDLADPSTPVAIEAALNQAGLNIDFLINNAGAGGPDLLDDPDWTQQRDYLQLMMLSVAEMCHRFVPPMRARGYGRVINVASVAARILRGGDTNYGPSKAYLVALSESMQHLKSEGVHVNALCPGFTHTEFHAAGQLAEMKAGLPGFLWYNADVVVRDGLRAVERGRAVCISGRLYRWLDPLLQSKLTRPLIMKLA